MTSLALGFSRTVCEQTLLVHRQYFRRSYFTHVLKLCHFRAGNVNEWFVVLNNALIDKWFHAEMVVPHTKMLKVSPGEDQRAEVVIDGLEQ